MKPWMFEEVRRIGQQRFDSTYWPWLDQAIYDSTDQSMVVVDPKKPATLAGFVLTCPSNSLSAKLYPVLSDISLNYVPQNAVEIAFVAVDTAWEGKGLARRMLSEVLLCCKATHQNCWLHVDTDNPRAKGLYESLGFQVHQEIPDLYGARGYLMITPPLSSLTFDNFKLGRDTNMKIGPTLFNTGPCQAEHPFTGGIFTPPLMTSTRHSLPCVL
jgi:ribosomal protein S18 acetylase RimI-like enzyme